MKLQNLTVIFSIIIIPVTLILSAYIGSQIDTASLQQSYDTKLMDATHDAVVAFELNSENNNYSTNADSIRRDIKAALNTFSSSLASGLGVPGANPEYIMPYIPAILITMYDGYYIYSPSEYSYRVAGENKTGYTHILKPYVYYSAKYEDNSDNYIIVNYSLDNYISLYGVIDSKSVAKSGYLATQDTLNNISDSDETLTETIKYNNDDGTITEVKNCTFVYRENKKVYKIEQKWYTLTGVDLMPYNNSTIENETDNSAKSYKKNVTWFINYLKNDDTGKKINAIVTPNHCSSVESSDNTQILTTGDPEDPSSLFNQHKREIIRASIQDNLNNAMAIYNENSASMGTNATFTMPKMSEEDWEKILTNVNIVSFMQGLPVGNKTYNNYSIVTSTNNKQYVSPNSIYFVDNNTDNNNKYHTIYHVENADNVTGYKSQDFRKIKYEENKTDSNGDTTEIGYYYRRPEYACYDCMVSTHGIANTNDNIYEYIKKCNDELKKKYYTALARERFNLDKVTKIFM